MVVQDGTGHGAVLDHLLALLQSVNAQQVDVLAHNAAVLLDSSSCAQSHAVIVAEDDFDVGAVLCQSCVNDLVALSLVPVTNVLNQALDSDASVGQSLDGVLGTVLCIGVLGVTNDHDVLNDAVAVQVALVVQSQDHLALVGAGLTSVSADVANLLVVDDALVGLIAVLAQGLTVDQDQGDVSSDDLVDDDFGRRGLNQVADDDVHLLSDEGVDLVGLLSHVVLAVDHGDFVLNSVGLQGLEVVFNLLTVQGHEVVVVLVDSNADLVGLNLSCCLGSCGSFGSCGSLGSYRSSGTTSDQGHSHNQCQDQCKDLFHSCFSSFNNGRSPRLACYYIYKRTCCKYKTSKSGLLLVIFHIFVYMHKMRPHNLLYSTCPIEKNYTTTSLEFSLFRLYYFNRGIFGQYGNRPPIRVLQILAVIDSFIDCGVNCFYPCEPAAGMDMVQLKKKYGPKIFFKGGIDKFALRKDKEAIRKELEYKMSEPMLGGGTIFALDHRIPNGVSLENYKYYVNTGRELLGLPPIAGEGWDRMAF